MLVNLALTCLAILTFLLRVKTEKTLLDSLLKKNLLDPDESVGRDDSGSVAIPSTLPPRTIDFATRGSWPDVKSFAPKGPLSEAASVAPKGPRPIAWRKTWPQSVIPYEVDDRFDDWSKMKIEKALKLFTQVTCLRFIPRSRETDYLRFQLSEYCNSKVGRVGGRQDINLSVNCLTMPHYKGAVVHEIMHALGFIHEQMREDRDCYVVVTGRGKSAGDFAIYFGTDTTFIYDFRSIMHYKARDYLRGKRGEKLGNYVGTLTKWDKMKLNYLYCGGPHFCDIYPRQCAQDEKNEKHCRVVQ